MSTRDRDGEVALPRLERAESEGLSGFAVKRPRSAVSLLAEQRAPKPGPHECDWQHGSGFLFEEPDLVYCEKCERWVLPGVPHFARQARDEE